MVNQSQKKEIINSEVVYRIKIDYALYKLMCYGLTQNAVIAPRIQCTRNRTEVPTRR